MNYFQNSINCSTTSQADLSKQIELYKVISVMLSPYLCISNAAQFWYHVISKLITEQM
jgi:hypothetical protein